MRARKVKRTVWAYEVRRSRVSLASEAPAVYADTVTDASVVASIFRGIVGDPPREHFLAFYLDNASHVMGYETIAIGGAASVHVEPAQVFRGALLGGAVRLIIAHNHPSGAPEPSPEDNKLTHRLVAAAELISIPILDHVIVTANGFYSYCERGKL